MENWFSLSPCNICFHVHQAFASKLLLQGSPVVLVCPPQNMSARRVPAVEKAWKQSCTSFRQDLCSDLFTAFKPPVLSEHNQSQRDIKTCLLRIVCVQAPPLTRTRTHCSFSTKTTHIFAGFWLLCIKIVKRLSQLREMGRECIEPGKVMAYSLWLSWNGALQYFYCDKCIRISETDGNNLKFNSVPARPACNTHIVSYCQNVIGCLILFVGKGWVCILNGLISLLT